MLPAILVAWISTMNSQVNPTSILVLSQVVLSFVLPLPVITLVMFTRRKDLMGTLVNGHLITTLAILCSAVIIVLNVVLLYLSFAPTPK